MPPPPANGDLNSHPVLSGWRSLPMLVYGSLFSIHIPIWSSYAFPFQRLGWFSVSALNSKWGHGSPVWWASFLWIFSFLQPSSLELRSSLQIERQTDNGHQCIMPPHYGQQGHNKVHCVCKEILENFQQQQYFACLDQSAKQHLLQPVPFGSKQHWKQSASASIRSFHTIQKCWLWCLQVMRNLQAILDIWTTHYLLTTPIWKRCIGFILPCLPLF